MRYVRLTLIEREEISRYLASGAGLREIARKLNRNVSTISREVGRYTRPRTKYRAIASHNRAFRNASSRNFGNYKLKKNKQLLKAVVSKFRLYWSPDQIAKFLKQQYQDPKMHISPESIYTYIFILPRGELREELTQHLRHGHKRRRKQGVVRNGSSWQVEDMISIEERPAEVADRSVPGHWEGDIIIGGAKEQTALGTLVERTTRALILVPLKNKTAEEVRKAFAKELKKIPKELRLSLTYDQGREMAQHKLFTKETKMQVYFAHPKSPWERGTNENTNGLLRQFFPKNTNFYNVSRKDIKKVQDLMNGRPRKTLNYKTPYEAFQELLQ